jgi:hypothetical protein
MPTTDELIHALDLLTLSVTAHRVRGLDTELRDAIDHARPWVAGPNVVGSGVAPRVTQGKHEEEIALKVYVTRKLPRTLLPQEQLVPETVELPGIDGLIPTDVEAIGIQQLQSLSARVRPLQPAYSIGLPGVETGTLGCVVAERSDPLTPLLLSNSHVLAQSGLARQGARIVQPGPEDGGAESDQIGALHKSVVFDFAPGFNNLCDAALAIPDDRSNVLAEIPLVGMPKPGAPPVAPGTLVQKSGRTTGHTTGVIKDVNYRTLMSYPRPGGGWGTVGFRDQVLCERYSDGGDSGALVCDMEGRAVGLHWCGSRSTSVFSPIRFVFELLDVQLWTGQIGAQ